MKIQLFKTRFGIKFVPFFILFSISACVDLHQNADTNDDTSSDEIKIKAVQEVILMDEGAVVPMSKTHRVVVRMKNPENILLSYFEQNEDNSGEIKGDFTIDEDTREEIRDEMEDIADFAQDGLNVKPGKQLCVGMNSMKVAVVFNTGDTSRFSVYGSARCDPSLYPSVWALDSLATEMFRASKKNF